MAVGMVAVIMRHSQFTCKVFLSLPWQGTTYLPILLCIYHTSQSGLSYGAYRTSVKIHMTTHPRLCVEVGAIAVG